MGDNGGFGRDGVGQVQALAREVRLHDHRERHLRADHDELHRRADADQELERAGALALDRHPGRDHDREGVQAAPALAAARAHGRQPLAAVPRRARAPTSTARSSTATSATSGGRCRGATRTGRTPTAGRAARQAPDLRLQRRRLHGALRVQGGMERGGFSRGGDQHRARDEDPRATDARRQALLLAARTTAGSSCRACGPAGSLRASRRPCSARHSRRG